MSNPYAPHPHPLGLASVPYATGAPDSLQPDTVPVQVPGDDELDEMKRADLADLAGRLKLSTKGNRADLIERIREHRDREPEQVDDLDDLDDAELAGAADDLGLDTTGDRAELIARIREHRDQHPDHDS